MLDTRELPLLRALAGRYPTTEAALAEIGHLRAILSLPKGTVHVVSDVHGEHRKLKHIINNASGSLRPLVERVFGDRLTAGEKRALLSVIYYPRESYAPVARGAEAARRAYLRWTLAREVEVIRELSRRYTLRQVDQAFPADMRGLLRELVSARAAPGEGGTLDALVEPFVQHGREIEILRAAARAIRNLTVFELVVAGDLGDRGPRLDKVLEYLMRQPRARVVWGNHDVSWMGASLGQEALIATVVRLSLRYGRLSQLEEGFGIPVAPVDRLARTAYADDPAERFAVRGEGLRDALLMARMQKAMAVLQFKLEGQLCRRRPEYALEHRCLLHRIDQRAGTVAIDGEVYPLLDARFPTLDPALESGDPYALTPDEAACIALLKESFLKSPVLARRMRWMVQQGTTWLRRDRALIFHGCVPVDGAGELLPFVVDGEPRRGRALFDALERAVRRAFRARAQEDVDLLWYLWTGPLSPMFGKDRMTTFESYFVADARTHRETKNPYFHLIHDAGFCTRVCREFGLDEARGLIVNGHVPVRVEQGESPIKASHRAVTIDGAFSEAYGDKGYTLVLEASGARLAQHHHFTSVEQAVETGEDIIPEISDVEVYEAARTVGDTEKGEELAREIEILERLIQAYEDGVLLEQPR
ncbi:fructose-bisphosphatase class III [Sorangium sp. So ce176]|uniref:fructose-bisphosphatase class III n=1 Tax=Sorangium sp. So ce176 TaxID=3133286 RepID=UPI003F5E3999